MTWFELTQQKILFKYRYLYALSYLTSLRDMSCKSTCSRSADTSFTTHEVSTEETPDQAVKTRTKRYTFYWQIGADGPVLLRVSDYDGTDVTTDVDPPDEMYERVRRNRGQDV